MPCVGQTVLGADGEPRWHEVSLIPERDDRGEVVSVLAIGCDVTERKHVETMLAEPWLTDRELLRLEIVPREVFLQTPGSQAGRLLEDGA